MEATWMILTTKVEVDESYWGEGKCVRVPARMEFLSDCRKYCCPCFSKFSGTWIFCWSYQSQFEANIWSLILPICPRKHPSNWKFSKIKLCWGVFKKEFFKIFKTKTESFWGNLDFFWDSWECWEFFEKFESFF